jgi:uracil-DNA glycosylase
MDISKLIDQVGPDWAELLKGFMVEPDEEGKVGYDDIALQLKTDKDNKRPFYPAGKYVFEAFRQTPLDKVRVVILAGEPYPKEGYANGLALATDKTPIPVSLKVLFEGLEEDWKNGLDLNKPMRTGDLSAWTKQGVLLLNTALTVGADAPGSHGELWKPFTEYLIKQLTSVKRDLVWIALGPDPKKFTEPVNPFRSFIYLAEHPAKAAKEKRKWKHNNVFTKTNLALKLNGLGDPIAW